MNPEYQKWVTKLLGFDFEIQFRLGLENKVADTLSKIPHNLVQSLQLLTLPYSVDLEQLSDQIQQDPYLKLIYIDLLANPTSQPGFSFLQSRLFYKNMLVGPSHSPPVFDILRKGHSSPMGGHSSILKTLKRMTTSFYWVGMKSIIQKFVTHCDVFQRNKSSNLAP